MTNTHILQCLNFEKNRHKQYNDLEVKYFGHIKHHNSLERTVIEGMVPVGSGRGRSQEKRRWKVIAAFAILTILLTKC